MIGQSLGAGQTKRAIQAGHEAVLQCTFLTVAVAVFFYFCAGAIFDVMSADLLVREAGTEPFRVLALFQPLLGISIVYVHCLRGAGDTRSPLLITIVGVMLVRLPVAYYFGIVQGGGLMGVWMGMCCDMIWRSAAAWLRYRGGAWVKTTV